MSFSGENYAVFDDDGYLGFDARLSSQRFDSFTRFDEFGSDAEDGVFVGESVMDTSLPVYGSGDRKPELNVIKDASVLPILEDTQNDKKGCALQEWRRLNAIRLAEKDKEEKEMRIEILLEAEEYKAEFYKRRQVTIEKKKVSNRDKQKMFLENHEKFHKEAAANYWKAIAELVPREVPAIEKRGKKDRDKKKPSITVIQGPKPGKPTDLSRMRQILSKLKHRTPPHLMPAHSPPTLDSKTDSPTLHAQPSQAVAAA